MSSPAAAEFPIFDPAAVEKLRKVAGDQGDAFIAEMAQLFLDEATKMLAEMREGCERQDWKTVGRIAHSVKSSSATLGFPRLAHACKALELDTRAATETSATRDLADTVFSQFEQAIPTLKEMILIS